MEFKLIHLNGDIDDYFYFCDLIIKLKEHIIKYKLFIVNIVKLVKTINKLSLQVLNKPYKLPDFKLGWLNQVLSFYDQIYNFYSYNIFFHIMCKEDRVNNVIEHTYNFLYFYFGVDKKQIKDNGGLLMTMIKYNITPF